MSRSTNLLYAGGGALAALAASGAAGERLDAARLVAELAVTCAAAAGAASVAWAWPKSRIERSTAAAIAADRRHHEGRGARRPGPAAGDMARRPAAPVEPTLAQQAALQTSLRTVLAAEPPARPDYVDPYLAQAAAGDWPAAPEPAVDDTADLYAHPQPTCTHEAANEEWIRRLMTTSAVHSVLDVVDQHYPHLPSSPA